MADVDYGYGTEDYGYGDDNAPTPTTDYGYGDDNADYGYGDPYGDEEPAPQTERRPKRRNSVTKFSLVSQETPVLAADVINNYRKGMDSAGDPATPQPAAVAPAPEAAPEKQKEPRKKKGALGRFRKRMSMKG